MQEIDILKRSGIINNKAQKLAQKLVKPGISLLEIGTKIETFIKEANAVPAWPVNLSLNEEAAHSTYNPEETIVLQEKDVLKVDIGVSIDGYITDSSQTFTFTKDNEKLKEASIQALLCAKNYLCKNPETATISSLGEIIENKINSYGFKSISNLTGHTITRYNTHNHPSIPNVKNNLNILFKDIGSWFAVEPFVTTGRGYITEGTSVFIFKFEEDLPIRNTNARKLLEEIKTFNGLAFSEFWIGKEMSLFDKKIAMRELLKAQIISAYPVLIEKASSLVSQSETTFIYEGKEVIDLVDMEEILI